MDEETKKRFPKEFSIFENKDSFIKEPTGLNDICPPLGIGLPDIYKRMEKERYSFPKIEDIQNRIDILKTQENTDPDLIELLEEMKKASEVQIRVDSDPMGEIKEFKSVQDLVRVEQASIIKGIRQPLSNESIQIINKQIELDPVIFRSKYPELFDYVKTLKD
jgi:predicted DNA-binding transcriptional regulator AlpA